jgi:hypothetical protein
VIRKDRDRLRQHKECGDLSGYVKFEMSIKHPSKLVEDAADIQG